MSLIAKRTVLTTHEEWLGYIEPILVSINEKRPDFEEMVTVGQTLKQKEGVTLWAEGDLALMVETIYGEDRLGEFAGRIGARKSTLQNRRTLCDFWKVNTRWQLIEDLANLYYSHFIIAMYYGRKMAEEYADQLSYAEQFLYEASKLGWSVPKMDTEYKDRTGQAPQYVKIDDVFAKVTKVANGLQFIVTSGDTMMFEDGMDYKLSVFKSAI